MAKTVYDSKTIQLQDGTDVTLVPLAIGLLRKFMKSWQAFSEVKTEDDAFEVYVNCCGIALSKQLAGKFEKPLDAEDVLSDDYREYIEEVLDMDTIFEIMDVCGGLKLNDPKLLEQMEELVQQQETSE